MERWWDDTSREKTEPCGKKTLLVLLVEQLVEVAGSIPDGVTGIFHRHNPSCRTVALGSS